MLEISGLCKSFGKNVILRDVSFELQLGKIYCLLGRNGAGKTTLMKILAGILRWDKGEIVYFGKEAYDQHVSYIPETPVLLDYLTANEHLRFVMKLNDIKMSEEEYSDFVDKMEIKKYLDKLIITYSHGMKHQLSLAINFMIKPKILLLDEPLVSLDPIAIHSTRKKLVQYAKEGHIVFISTHMIPIAQRISDEILILSNEKIHQVSNKFTEHDLEQYVLKMLS